MRMGRLDLTNTEIDHNFSRAHRIVTSSILPIVEQYGNHSRDVWEGSKASREYAIHMIPGLA
jgi:DASH complex subunit ASK1